jgi:hypothetical protein
VEEPESDYDPPAGRGRARRGLGLIAVSVLAIGVTAVAYVHPSFNQPDISAGPSTPTAYQLAAVDFVSPKTGWFAATFDSGRFALMHTTDAGGHWALQLRGDAGKAGLYVNFFNATDGVVAVLGPQPAIYRTANGGRRWSSIASSAANLTSVSFVDPLHGWMLLSAGETRLVRTADGGASWTNLGSPVIAKDQAYRVQFSDLDAGWLDSVSSRPYAYRSADGGATWQQVPLPAPRGGWPAKGQFFVAAQATRGTGVVATVATVAPTFGRSGIGGNVVAYPPLTVRTFDGGVPVYYTYVTYVDAIPNAGLVPIQSENRSGSTSQVQAPNQVQLGSLDGGTTWTFIASPSATGAIGYSDAQNWWWIGSGAWSTSSNGGTSWTPDRNIAVPQPIPGSLQVLDSLHAWFGSVAGTRALLESTSDGGIHWKMTALPAIQPG